jgi:hypothetical protein
MQGLFERFGKKNPEHSTVSGANRQQHRQRPQSEFEDGETDSQQDWATLTPEERDPIASRFDTDDEETNWDDAATFGDENNPIEPRVDRQITDPQPTLSVVAPTEPTSDLDEWAEALPAATVKSSNTQEARRSKHLQPGSPSEDIWDEDSIDHQWETPGKRTFSPNTNLNPTTPSQAERVLQQSRRYASWFWASTLDRFRRFLPAPLCQLSDAILTAIVVTTIVTVVICFVDGFFVPGSDRSVATSPAPIVAQPSSAPTAGSEPTISPEQAFIEAIQSQLSDITSQYPDDIVRTLNVDIAHARLIVQLNPIWYTIDEEQQNILTDRLWLQARSNHFTKLEIQDSQGISIARSPVVGKHPIILQRRQS